MMKLKSIKVSQLYNQDSQKKDKKEIHQNITRDSLQTADLQGALFFSVRALYSEQVLLQRGDPGLGFWAGFWQQESMLGSGGPGWSSQGHPHTGQRDSAGSAPWTALSPGLHGGSCPVGFWGSQKTRSGYYQAGSRIPAALDVTPDKMIADVLLFLQEGICCSVSLKGH